METLDFINQTVTSLWPLLLLIMAVVIGYYPYKLCTGCFGFGDGPEPVDNELTRFQAQLVKFLFRIFTGPVFAVCLVGLLCVYQNIRYERACQEFQTKLDAQETVGATRLLELKSQLATVEDNNDYEKFVRTSRLNDVMCSLQQSHPLGVRTGYGQLAVQQVEGYTPTGQIIWSNDITVFQKVEKGFYESRFGCSDLSATWSKSEPFDLTVFKDFKPDLKDNRLTQLASSVWLVDQHGLSFSSSVEKSPGHCSLRVAIGDSACHLKFPPSPVPHS